MEGKNKIISLVIVGLLIALASFFGGLYMNIIRTENIKCKTDTNPTETEKVNDNIKKEEPVKSEEKEQAPIESKIDVKDQFAINTYGGELKYYTISNGKVYYKLEKNNFVGINVCPPTNDYCIHNSTYNNNVTEIKEITNAKRIKTVLDIKASGEAFIYFVITDNKVYELSEKMDMDMNYTGVNVTLIEELSNKNIIDLVDIRNRKYIFTTSTGEEIEY